MQLSAEAAAAGGYCKALMGNHELLLLGAKRFGDTPVNSGGRHRLLPGRLAAQRRPAQPTWSGCEDHHVAWMSRLDAVAVEDGHLLVHSDTTAYLDYGTSIDDVNDAVTGVLTPQRRRRVLGPVPQAHQALRLPRRRTAPHAVRELLDAYGGRRIVHGHSPIPYLLGEVGTEDGGDEHRPAR